MQTYQSKNIWKIALIICIAVIAILVAYYWYEPQSNLPLKISYTLDPSTVKENQPSKLTFSITNVNKTLHEVQFIFNTDPRLTIYSGTEELLANNIYNFTLGDYETDQVREFTITGLLEQNIASTKYQIEFQVSLNKQIVPELTKNIYLTITEE